MVSLLGRRAREPQADLIVALTNTGARAAKQATRTIPIVMAYVFDPVREGLVASLARPGGNVTGLTFIISPEIVGKQVELLKEAVPKVSRVAVLVNRTNPVSAVFWTEAQAAAQVLAVKRGVWASRTILTDEHCPRSSRVGGEI